MSSVNLKHSSGNGTKITGPVANPSADITLKVPSTTGTAGQVLKVASANHSATNAELEWGADSGGKILQVVQSTKTNESLIVTGTTWTNVPGTDESGSGSIWEVNITPSATSSKILVQMSAVMGGNNGVSMTLRLMREIADANVTSPFLGDALSNRGRSTRLVRDDQTAMKAHAMHQSHFMYLDSPNTTSKVTYHLESHGYDANDIIYINRSHGIQAETNYDDTQASTLLVMEVAG